jgi:oxygen-independent coproporphyrinogen-3 oxidase
MLAHNVQPHKFLTRMAGIYLHIPFCKQKCHYCNFFSLASIKNKMPFLKALEREIVLQQEYLHNEQVQTIYFGGGTPSMLEADELKHILQTLGRHYRLSPDVEITLEGNPDDLTLDKIKQFRALGINRLSIGIQSFNDDDLAYLNRVHNASHAKNVIKNAFDAGFEKLTIDLIYGIPTLTDKKWIANVDYFLETGIKHLSAYALTVEPRTALAQLIGKGKLKAVDEQQSVRHFEILMQRMEAAGFVHYEISNFAKPGHYSKHNSLYWIGGNYLGLGPSAHSYNGISRQWNVSHLTKYISEAGQSESVFEKEELTLDQRYDEYVMTSLRTSWGCDLEHIQNAFGEQYSNYCREQAQSFIRNEKIEQREHRLFLTQKGKLFADGIAAELFI